MADYAPIRYRYLREIGIDLWVSRARGKSGDTSGIPVQAPVDPELDWDGLRRRVVRCQACELSRSRTQTVFGVGSTSADWLFVGEAPGADEDRQGEPFVGRAGKLLDAMLFALGLHRSQVYIANTVKCRPPENRNPRPEEMRACAPILQRQIELLRPKIIVALGGIAANQLLESDERVGRLRGQVLSYGPEHIPLVVTYHPAYLLRSPAEKAKVWSDLRRAAALYNGLVGGEDKDDHEQPYARTDRKG